MSNAQDEDARRVITSLHFLGGESEPRLVVPDIARERLANLLQPLQDRLHARALLRGKATPVSSNASTHVLLELAVDTVGGAVRWNRA